MSHKFKILLAELAESSNPERLLAEKFSEIKEKNTFKVLLSVYNDDTPCVECAASGVIKDVDNYYKVCTVCEGTGEIQNVRH